MLFRRFRQSFKIIVDNNVHTSCFRNRTMRTVTNYFIVNLAVADFLVILICLPPTVLWDVTETWFMGTLACKIVLYFQVSAFIIPRKLETFRNKTPVFYNIG